MQEYPTSRYPVPRVDELPADIRDRIVAVQEKLGFIPNVFLTLAHRPEEFRAFFAYFDALMLKESGLSKTEREMIVVATTAANHCIYCVVHHSAILRLRAKNALIADQVAINYRRADLSPREHDDARLRRRGGDRIPCAAQRGFLGAAQARVHR